MIGIKTVRIKKKVRPSGLRKIKKQFNRRARYQRKREIDYDNSYNPKMIKRKQHRSIKKIA